MEGSAFPVGQGNGNGTVNTNPQEGNSPNPGGNLPITIDPNVRTEAPKFQIDPRYQSLPVEEAIARTVQGRETGYHQEIKSLKEQNEKFNGYIQTLELIMDPQNKEARLAFIRELEPDLVQSVDIDDQVKKELDKEFGKDFAPDQDEAKTNHWSQSAKYFRKMDRLYKDIEEKSKSNGVNKTFAEIKKEIASKRGSQSKATEEEIKALRAEENIDDNTFNQFSTWAKGLKLKDFWTTFKSINKFEQKNPSFTGFNTFGNNPSETKNKIDQLFGPDRSKF